MKLVPKIDVPSSLPDLTFSLFGLPLTLLGQLYYAAALGGDFTDLSFGFADDAGLSAVVACNTANRSTLTCFDFPIELWLRQELGGECVQRLARDILGTLKERAKSCGATSIQLRAPQDRAFDGAISARLLAAGAKPEASHAIMLDLTMSDDALMAGLSSGHRQQVRAGAKAMSLVHIDHTAPDKAAFDSFRELHAAVAGRITRPRESWDRMYDMLAAGKGDLALTYWNGELLGGTLMLDAGDVAYYASGAYVRSHFDKPLAHYPLFECITRARSRGRTRVHLGELMPTSLTDSDKELSIGKFKLGFASSVVPSTIWTIPVTG